jgi:molybdopterin-containing oxidoreductase family iron-sulfur binding subunit
VTLVGAGMALAGLAGCVRKPDREIVPYVDTPPEVVPGNPLHYATSMAIDGYATGLIVESHEGRPTKIEGNPDHPASLGAAGILEQASVLHLYDPHRATSPRAGRRRVTVDAVRAALAPVSLAQRVGARGAGLRLVLEPTASPLIVALLDRVRERYPDARVFFHAPLGSSAPIVAARSALGAPLVPQYDFTNADIVVSLDADFLASGPFHLRHAADFARGRHRTPPPRLYVAETKPSPTGTLADHRIALPPSAVKRTAAALLEALAPSGGAFRAGASLGPAANALAAPARAWVAAVAGDLAGHRGRAIVVAGAYQPAEVHTIAFALNDLLGSVGRTTWYTKAAVLEAGESSHDVSAFASNIDHDVDTVVMLDVNVCYAAPAELDLPRRIRAVPNAFYLGAYDDETARTTTWHVPASHYLESWGDARAYDGTMSLIQPLIAPMYESLSTAEVLAALAGLRETSVYDLLTQGLGTQRAPSSTPDVWAETLRRGVVPGSAWPPLTPSVRLAAAMEAHAAITSRNVAADTIEIAFVAGAGVHDGRFANNAWLQELPDPITKLTWDNAALVGPALAASHRLASGDIVRLTCGAGAADVPLLIVPGHADSAISIAMGYGRGGGEAVARGVGVDVNRLRTAHEPFAATVVGLTATGRRKPLAITQTHWTIEARAAGILGEDDELGKGNGPPRSPTQRRPLTLYEPPAPPSTGFGADQWAMTIDLDLCTGCSACVVACQAENNVPVVGRAGVLESREMHWLRIDRYVVGETASPRFEVQPMLCQHCEKAPCEYVCPVNATVHSDDGLNEMVYNRCVGTRFCSNNCPYKVRRFNWFDYNDELAETERMAKNPSVTVRERGVMEKCTFCVQRIRRAQIDAELAGETHTGPVVTACQQACPTHAIVFGSLTDPTSEVARLAHDERAFSALEELGTVPRVRYLRRARNPNPALADGAHGR